MNSDEFYFHDWIEENELEFIETSSEKIDDKEFIEIENKIDSVNTSVEISDESEEKNDAL
ncbi:hypothetical protein [Treponema sp. UBA6852]|uniref:hypothetical protein n=1 Tax=Treponema sp. UBA6852 TaxID=1947744 RepID=UPI000E941893|nr:hypothetical protein [Treponema sp. UBA6852]HBP08829.1 hypothetical protein [Treponema sp.]